MKELLNDLTKLSEFTAGSNDPRKKLLICKECELKKSQYSLVFYNSKLQTSIPIMFISRDPNIKETEIRKYESILKTVRSWGTPRRNGLGYFFNDFLMQNGIWNEFMQYLDSVKNNRTRFYWTHLVKCYALNDVNKVNAVQEYCAKYLIAEIEKLNPKLIIACGKEDAKSLYRLGRINIKYMPECFADLTCHNQAAYKSGEGTIIIPHPSGQAYQNWKKGNFPQVGISHQQLKKIINNAIK